MYSSGSVSYTHLDVYKRQDFICFVLSSQSHLSEGKKDSFARSLFLYEKENIEIVLTGVQLKKKCIDFRAMSDKILTRKNKRTDFQEGK